MSANAAGNSRDRSNPAASGRPTPIHAGLRRPGYLRPTSLRGPHPARQYIGGADLASTWGWAPGNSFRAGHRPGCCWNDCWSAIREGTACLQRAIKEHKLATGTWKVGDTPVDRLLGKELCVLAWAVEQLDPEKSVAVRNWFALRPEERWWLFGMTAIATGGISDAEKGWRVALRYALGDMAQNEADEAAASQALCRGRCPTVPIVTAVRHMNTASPDGQSPSTFLAFQGYAGLGGPVYRRR